MLRMALKSIRPSRPAMIVHSVSRVEDHWLIEAESHARPRCPSCGRVSERQHSWYQRTLPDLPLHCVPVLIRLRVRKWRCAAPACQRAIFAEPLPGLDDVIRRRVKRPCLWTDSAMVIEFSHMDARASSCFGHRMMPLQGAMLHR